MTERRSLKEEKSGYFERISVMLKVAEVVEEMVAIRRSKGNNVIFSMILV